MSYRQETTFSCFLCVNYYLFDLNIAIMPMNKETQMEQKITILCIILFLLALNTRLKIVHYTMTSHKLSHPIRLALITNLHSYKYGNTLIDAIKKEQPDLLLLY